MGRSTLRIVERFLITLVSIVLLAIVWSSFARTIEPTDHTVAARTLPSTAAPDAVSLPTTEPPVATTTTTTTTTAAPVVAVSDGECAEPRPEPEDGIRVLTIFYTCGEAAAPTGDFFVYRAIPFTEGSLRATLDQLELGPDDDERALGFRSVFGSAGNTAINGFTLEQGSAVIDFDAIEGLEAVHPTDPVDFFLATMNANVFQFTGISSVEYRLSGDCGAFWELLGAGSGCQVISRDDFESEMEANRDLTR